MKTIVLVVALAAAVSAWAGEVDAGGLPRGTLGHRGVATAVERSGCAAGARLIDPQLDKQPFWRYLPASQRRALRELQRRLRW